MRHLGSLALSLVLGPMIWLLTGFGLSKYGEARLDLSDAVTITELASLVALAAAGVLLAGLLLPRLSPVGPLLLGIAFFGLCVWSAVDRRTFFDTMPVSFLGARARHDSRRGLRRAHRRGAARHRGQPPAMAPLRAADHLPRDVRDAPRPVRPARTRVPGGPAPFPPPGAGFPPQAGAGVHAPPAPGAPSAVRPCPARRGRACRGRACRAIHRRPPCGIRR